MHGKDRVSKPMTTNHATKPSMRPHYERRKFLLRKQTWYKELINLKELGGYFLEAGTPLWDTQDTHRIW